MACGSIAQAESLAIERNLLIATTRNDHHLNQPTITGGTINSSTPNDESKCPTCQCQKRTGLDSPSGFRSPIDTNEAILFLQKEHEVILAGLHLQIRELQQKCNDLQFTLHMQQVASSKEESLKVKLKESAIQSEEQLKTIEDLEDRLKKCEEDAQEERQQNRWKEVQTEQKLIVSEQRVSELKSEVSSLKEKLQDIQQQKNFEDQHPHSSNDQISSSSSTKSSIKLLNDSKLGSSNREGSLTGDNNSWKEGAMAKLSSCFKSRFSMSPHFSANARSLHSSSLRPVQATPPLSRPATGTVTLPPITPHNTRSINTQRHLRLLSAPALNPTGRRKGNKGPKHPP